ncbi:uncharacterized protein STEHIDRAFT_135228 [Stereum hirsutum FP-91666 SS1]|uniref:Uncharacterized protein n=1 Tax=Stereum hirsutum (strain FP-91666) TaxID=721885 RepID=R7RY99_STEHR|nr:uncharacterized protein STEHIDRAFT_135228 [Stereum hirsutum FP-91666 SS1]EIM80309.1 hypothetical protein STEHIDRAFT_135228 [Stereum hirsutum FP-91666 SS1]
MAATTQRGAYSSIFASGLLATPRAHSNSPPPSVSPMSVDLTMDSTPTRPSPNHTPTASTSSSLTPTPTSTTSDVFGEVINRSRSSSTASTASSVTNTNANGPPRFRRRRSSLTVQTTAMGNIKSPLNNAGAALQRTAIAMMSPSGTRSRSGTVSSDVAAMTLSEPPASADSTLKGRGRSGSLGDALRSRRNVRQARPPPPSAPLPALPPLPPLPPMSSHQPTVSHSHDISHSPSHSYPLPIRRPSVSRSLTSESFGSFGSGGIENRMMA